MIRLAYAYKGIALEEVPVEFSAMKSDLALYPFGQSPRYVCDIVSVHVLYLMCVIAETMAAHARNMTSAGMPQAGGRRRGHGTEQCYAAVSRVLRHAQRYAPYLSRAMWQSCVRSQLHRSQCQHSSTSTSTLTRSFFGREYDMYGKSNKEATLIDIIMDGVEVRGA
jgi:hypothetical protein